MKLMTKIVKTNTTPVTISLYRDAMMLGYSLFAETTLGGKTFQVESFITDEAIVLAEPKHTFMEQKEKEILEKLSLSAFKILT